MQCIISLWYPVPVHHPSVNFYDNSSGQSVRHTTHTEHVIDDPKSKFVHLEARIETLKSDNERACLALDEVKAELRLSLDKANEDAQLRVS